MDNRCVEANLASEYVLIQIYETMYSWGMILLFLYSGIEVCF